jgi:hypothetical protein
MLSRPITEKKATRVFYWISSSIDDADVSKNESFTIFKAIVYIRIGRRPK